MKYFTIKKQFFLAHTPNMLEEYIKIDEFINLLENGGVEKIIEHLKYKDNLGNETAYVILKPIKKEE